jgi:Holliday junction resolvase
MPNQNYNAGRRFEYEVIKVLKEHLPNCTIIRSAGSKSPVDIVVIKNIKNVGRERSSTTIQCKTWKNNKQKTSPNI